MYISWASLRRFWPLRKSTSGTATLVVFRLTQMRCVSLSASYVGVVEVTNCEGYNGVPTAALTTTLPGSGTPFYGYEYAYYGPVSFFVGINTGVTAIEINGITTGLKTGSFVLYPRQSGVITLGGGTSPTFVMIGQ